MRVLSIIFILWGGLINAQDSLAVFSFTDFLQIVKNEHPVARQATLQGELGDLAILNARGGFDPRIASAFQQKRYAQKEYYRYFDAAIEIPTNFGLTFDVGGMQNQGEFINPELNTPQDGLFYAGVKVPIGQGLLMDERRAALRQAKVFKDLTEAQQKSILNNLLLSAGDAYWAWYNAYLNQLVFEDAFELANIRFEAVTRDASLGERPNIDTLEASIQLQNREVQLEQAILNFQNAKAYLEVFIWQNGRQSVLLRENLIPDTVTGPLSDFEFSSFSDSLVFNHPEMVQTEQKILDLEISGRWKREKLKPKLDLKYNLLTDFNQQTIENNGFDNYSWGVELSIPIFLREARGDVKMNQLKIDQAQQEYLQKEANLKQKVINALNQYNTYNKLITIQLQNVNNYQQLLEGERRLFDAGESSLFMVNRREMSYIEAQLKLNDLISKSSLAILKVQHAMGYLHEAW